MKTIASEPSPRGPFTCALPPVPCQHLRPPTCIGGICCFVVCWVAHRGRLSQTPSSIIDACRFTQLGLQTGMRSRLLSDLLGHRVPLNAKAPDCLQSQCLSRPGCTVDCPAKRVQTLVRRTWGRSLAPLCGGKARKAALKGYSCSIFGCISSDSLKSAFRGVRLPLPVGHEPCHLRTRSIRRETCLHWPWLAYCQMCHGYSSLAPPTASPCRRWLRNLDKSLFKTKGDNLMELTECGPWRFTISMNA